VTRKNLIINSNTYNDRDSVTPQDTPINRIHENTPTTILLQTPDTPTATTHQRYVKATGEKQNTVQTLTLRTCTKTIEYFNREQASPTTTTNNQGKHHTLTHTNYHKQRLSTTTTAYSPIQIIPGAVNNTKGEQKHTPYSTDQKLSITVPSNFRARRVNNGTHSTRCTQPQIPYQQKRNIYAPTIQRKIFHSCAK
jgi:hypothetical protein